jgi:DNA-binding NarL/FixJ family response regulator
MAANMCSRSSSRGPPTRRRILVVDDHPLVRRGLTALIDSEPDFTVCGEAASCRAGLEAIAALGPDLVIADLSLGDGEGLELIRQSRTRVGSVPILVLTMHDGPLHAKRALRAGASGYVSKQELSETLLIAMRRVLDGEEYVSPKIREALEAS